MFIVLSSHEQLALRRSAMSHPAPNGAEYFIGTGAIYISSLRDEAETLQDTYEYRAK
jgi:hypothetical protein